VSGGFQSPNYTQCPNDLFDKWLPGLGEAELKVLLFVARQTFGFHREDFRISLTNMMTATGLSRHGVLDGASAAEAHGLLRRVQDGGVTIWQMIVRTPPPLAGELVHSAHQLEAEVVAPVHQTGSPSAPPSIKETLKETGGGKKNGALTRPEAYALIKAHYDLGPTRDMSRDEVILSAQASLSNGTGEWRELLAEVVHG
jgi:hypothetical protein